MWLRASTNVRPSQRHLPHATPARHTLVVFESCALVWRWLGFRGVGSDGGRYLADEGTSGRNKECVWRERDSCAPRINRCPAMTSNGLKAASAGERRNGGQGAQSRPCTGQSGRMAYLIMPTRNRSYSQNAADSGLSPCRCRLSRRSPAHAAPLHLELELNSTYLGTLSLSTATR